MRTALLLTAVVWLVAGCESERPKLSEPGTPERACEDAAAADPKVRNLVRYQGGNANPLDFPSDYKAAREDSIRECLRVRMGRPSGGVEKLRK